MRLIQIFPLINIATCILAAGAHFVKRDWAQGWLWASFASANIATLFL